MEIPEQRSLPYPYQQIKNGYGNKVSRFAGAVQHFFCNWLAEVRGGGICPPECLCRRNGCNCGNIGALSILPLELLEQILLYQDPVSLLALERSSRGMAKLVSRCWEYFCKRRGLINRSPTPICVGWKTGKESNFSYDRALVASQSPDQRWRLLAVRFYLCEQNICIGCQSNYGEFQLKDDVLLCYRCSKIFCFYVTGEVENILKSHRVDRGNIGGSFAPVLLSDLIVSLRTVGEDERKCLKKLRPYLGCKGHSTCSLESTSLHPTTSVAANGIYFIPQRGCVVTGPNTCSCLENSKKRPRKCCGPDTEPDSSSSSLRPRKISSYFLSISVLLSIIHLVVISAVIAKHSSLRIVKGGFEPLQLACINGLIIFTSCFLVLFILKRLHRAGSVMKNLNSCTILLQCIVVASLITQITEILMTANFVAKFNDRGRTSIDELLVSSYHDNNAHHALFMLTNDYSCCIRPGIAWNTSSINTQGLLNVTSAPTTRPQVSNITCSSLPEKAAQPDCLSALGNTLMPLLICFIVMAVLMSFVHFGLLYLAQTFGRLFTNHTKASAIV